MRGHAVLFFLFLSATLNCLFSNNAFAVVIKTRAPLYPIIEMPLDDVILQKVSALVKMGEWQQRVIKANTQLETNLQQLPAVPFISVTEIPKTFYYNPSVIMPNDIKTPDGKILIAAGVMFDPLTQIALNETLLFYNAQNAKERCWAKKINAKISGIKKIILVGGNWVNASNELHRKVFFDQEGRITRQLGITHTPAIVTQDGVYLKISEVKACQ